MQLPEMSWKVVELARGIEPSNRRRIGPEACLTGSCGGGQPPRMFPTKGTHPLRNPWLEVRTKVLLKVFIRRREYDNAQNSRRSSKLGMELARGIEPPTCGLQNRCSAD